MRRAALRSIAVLAGAVLLGPAGAQQARQAIIPGVDEEADARAEQERRAKLRAAIEARVRAQVEKELRALADQEAKANARADARSKKNARKGTAAGEEQRPEAPPLPDLPSAVRDVVPVEPKAAELRSADPALAEVKLNDEPRLFVPATAPSGGAQVAMVKPASPAVVIAPAPDPNRAVAVPRDEPRPGRRADLRDDLQVGPQSLVLNRLSGSVDALPGAVAATFAYRLVNDDAGALHHHVSLGAQSAEPRERERDLRWFASAGFGPSADNAYRIPRSSTSNQLGWSAFTLAGGAARSIARGDSLIDLSLDAQLQGLSLHAAAQIAGAQQRLDVSTKQLRLRGGASLQTGRWAASAELGGFLYLGDNPEKLRGLPLRGVFIDDDLGGLASAPQSYQARLGGTVELGSSFTAGLRYSYLAYAEADWAGAHLVHGELAGRSGRLRGSIGLTWQYDAPRIQAPDTGIGDDSSFYLTGSIGYAF
jgi:hypothetical protein